MTLLAYGEHPTLPELVCELYPAVPEAREGRKVIPARPAYARWLLSPIRVMVTADPARLRRHAHELLALADCLELAHLDAPEGQQTLDEVG